MKKNMIVFILAAGLLLAGCGEQNETDYSEYLFTDVIWTRDNSHDIETIIFHGDGDFSYSCACGNPVNDSDLCESYTYNDETKEIKFDCIETTEEMVTSVKIIHLSETVLELDFNGETRKFEKENNIN
jgi:hypothetical protein